MALVGTIWENSNDENHSLGNVTSLMTLEALEVSSNPSSFYNDLDVHKLKRRMMN